MAKYTVEHTCAHSHTYNLIGKHTTREYRLERLRDEECPDCSQNSSVSHCPRPRTAGRSGCWRSGSTAEVDRTEPGHNHACTCTRTFCRVEHGDQKIEKNILTRFRDHVSVEVTVRDSETQIHSDSRNRSSCQQKLPTRTTELSYGS